MSFRIDQPRHIAEDVQIAGRIDKDNIKRAVKELKQSKPGQTPQVIRTQKPDINLSLSPPPSLIPTLTSKDGRLSMLGKPGPRSAGRMATPLVVHSEVAMCATTPRKSW